MYQDDILYRIAQQSHVFQGAPSNSEGQEGEERWCFIDGKGLYHVKKYSGEWRYRLYDNEILTEGEISSTAVTENITNIITSNEGTFTDLIVLESSSLAGSHSISGSLNISANLTNFPVTANLTVGPTQLDTVQSIQTGSRPQFHGIGIGAVNANNVAGDIQGATLSYNGATGAGANINNIVNHTEYLFTDNGVNYTKANSTTASDGIGLGTLTSAEVTQLKNIDSATIVSSQWLHVGDMDQDVATDSPVQFQQLSLTESGDTWTFDTLTSNAGGLTEGGLQITTANTADAPIIFGGASKDDHTLRSYGYESGLFLGDGWSIYEDNNLHNMEIDNLQVRGTLSVYELLIQQIRATNGSVFITSACKLETDGNALFHVTGGLYQLTFQSDEEDDKPHPFAVGDLILARRVDIDGDTTNIVSEVRFTVTAITGGGMDSNQLRATSHYSSITLPTVDATSSAVLNGFDFVRIGNTTDANRRGGIYLTSDDTIAPFIDIFDEVSSWQEWDGITNIFGLADGSFDLGTVGTYTGSSITGSSWIPYTAGSADVKIVANGGLSNQKYLELDRNNSGTAHVYQAITFPYVATGSYTVIIEWYGKQDPVTAEEPRIAMRNVIPSTAQSGSSFTAAGAYDGTQGQENTSFIDWEDITQPSSQPSATTVWHKYQWKLTVPNTMFSGTNDKVMYLVFSTASSGNTTVHVDGVRMDMDGKIKTRIGRLEGVGKSGYGLWSENVFLKGRIEAEEGYIGNEFAGWRIDSTGITNEGTSSYISAGQTTKGLDGGGSYLSGLGDLSLGNSGTAGLKWVNASNTLTVRGVIHMASGTIDSSVSLPATGKVFTLNSQGDGGSSGTVGFIGSDGTQLEAPSTGEWGVAVWDSDTNALDTDFHTNGIKWYNTGGSSSDRTLMTNDLNALANDTIVMMTTYNIPSKYINAQGGQTVNTNLVAAMLKCGATENALNQIAYQGSYILVGRKKAAAHSLGTELVGHSGDGGVYEIDCTVSLKDNTIDIVDFTGDLDDFDAESPRTFSYERDDGFKFKTRNDSDATVRTLISFTMPFIDIADADDLHLWMQTSNLSDNGVCDTKLYVNDTLIGSLSDPNNALSHIHNINTISNTVYKTDPGEVNVFQIRSSMQANSDTMRIYKIELRNNANSQVYSNGMSNWELDTNVIQNNGFETSSWANWTTALGTYDDADGAIQTFHGDYETGTTATTMTQGTYANLNDGQEVSSTSNGTGFNSTVEIPVDHGNDFANFGSYITVDNGGSGYNVNDIMIYNFSGISGGSGLAMAKVTAVSTGVTPTWTQSTARSFSGVTSALWQSSNDQQSAGSLTQALNLKPSTTYMLKWRGYYNKVLSSIPTFSLNNLTDTQSMQVTSSAVSFVATGGGIYNSWSLLGATGSNDKLQWNSYKIAFTTPSTWATTDNIQLKLFSGTTNNLGLYIDEVQIVEKRTDVSSGLYMTSDRIGFYNGIGGDDGWATSLNSDGSFFFGDPHNQANFFNPNSGGAYVRFHDSTLEVNANMVAGKISSIDNNTIFDLDDSNLAIKMDGNAANQVVFGDSIDNSTNHDIIVGKWATQTGNASAGQGILVKHTETYDYSTINIGGIHRRAYEYPAHIYTGFHCGWSLESGNDGQNTHTTSDYDMGYQGSTYNGTESIKDCKVSHFWGYDRTTVPSGRKLHWTFKPIFSNTIGSHWAGGGSNNGYWRWGRILKQGNTTGYIEEFTFLHNASTYFHDSTSYLDWNTIADWSNNPDGGIFYWTIQLTNDGHLLHGDIPAGTNVSNLWLASVNINGTDSPYIHSGWFTVYEMDA